MPNRFLRGFEVHHFFVVCFRKLRDWLQKFLLSILYFEEIVVYVEKIFVLQPPFPLYLWRIKNYKIS